jgi:3',5'-cyclic AMP phosphodiesterase CpdA
VSTATALARREPHPDERPWLASGTVVLTIAQLSDIHCGSLYFDPGLLNHAVEEVLALQPDMVVVAGDLTQEGYANEFQMARDALRPLVDELLTVVVPGNHDAKNVGYVHFEDHFGKGDAGNDVVVDLARGVTPERVTLVAVDSSKPDLAEGEVGRFRYPWIREQFATPSDLRIFALHHHLVPVPGTGRERNTVWDAGDVLAVLEESGVDLVLCGHKHVPHIWVVDGIMVVNSGTVSSFRLRGYARPSYNVVTIDPEAISVTLMYPGSGEKLAARYDRTTRVLDRNPELAGMFSKSTWGW